MKILVLFVYISLLSLSAQARILEIGSGAAYQSLAAATADAMPGDTIMYLAGEYAGGEFIENLQGNPDAWIVLMAEPGTTVHLRGGTSAIQFTDPAYLHIYGLSFSGQTGNGLNIDDGGSYDTPAHNLIIEKCSWNGIDATGNNDLLKLSGVDTFTVMDCNFRDGAEGGSLVDMVGCHFGVFENNTFENAGSNCIQAKGGSRFIRIERNRFVNGGQRTLNIGGSTGLEYFRPAGANYEASDIAVYANIILGSIAPVAFVGAVQCEVVNNTIIRPGKWAIRILQENTSSDFLACGENRFQNNIVYLDNRAAEPTINIGPNTRPESFFFSNNLWYNEDDLLWSGPNVPVPDENSILGRDPMFVNLAAAHFKLLPGSPAAGVGFDRADPEFDYYFLRYRLPRSIGAAEADNSTDVDDVHILPQSLHLSVAPQPAYGQTRLTLRSERGERLRITLHDLLGREVLQIFEGSVATGTTAFTFEVSSLNAGLYFIAVRSSDDVAYHPLLKH